jgi:Ring finger domain
MESAVLRIAQAQEMRFAHGPGIRGNECEICREEMTAENCTVTHVACENTFHTPCLNGWASACLRNSEALTCPKCRATLGEFILTDVIRIPFNVLPAMLPDEDMYDYSMGRDFPTPAFMQYMRVDPEAGVTYMSDYLIRLARVQDLTNAEVNARQANFMLRLSRGVTDDDAMREHLAETRDLDAARITDLEIIDDDGTRTPLDSFMEFFESEPVQARTWLETRYSGIRDDLHLDRDVMVLVRNNILHRVEFHLQSRDEALGQRHDGSNGA